MAERSAEPERGPDPERVKAVREEWAPRPPASPLAGRNDDVYLFKEGTLRQTSKLLGAHEMNDGAQSGFGFVTWAPNARSVSVVGDFNGWDAEKHAMKKVDGALWEVFVPGAEAGQKYKFAVDGARGGTTFKADPAARQAELRPNTASVLAGPDRFGWGDDAWMKARAETNWAQRPVSTYEVHLPSWRKNPDGTFKSYRQLAPELAAHLRATGFTHVELLGLLEHPFDGSWGYQVTGYYAPTSRHGSAEDFKYLVDYLHQRGIGVYIDWVPAHFPEDAHGLAKFDGTHLFDHEDDRLGKHLDWGTRIFNYGRNEVKSFLLGSLDHFLRNYHVDGIRVDAVASMLYRDYSRKDWIPNSDPKRVPNWNYEAMDFLRSMNDYVHKTFPGVVTIAEESTAFPGVTKPRSKGGLGFDFKWDMGQRFRNEAYFKTDPLFRKHHFDDLVRPFDWHGSERYVKAFAHDEVVHGKGNLWDKMPGDEWQRRANVRLWHANQFAQPGHKLTMMGTEFGQQGDWNANVQLPWETLKDKGHRQLMVLVGDLNRLYAAESALHERQYEADGAARIHRDAKNGVVAYVHRGSRPGDEVVAVGNTLPVVHHGYKIGVESPGEYAELLNTDSAHYGGGDVGNAGKLVAREPQDDDERYLARGRPYLLDLTLPPLGYLFLKRVEPKP